MCVTRMVTSVAPTSLIVVQKKLLVITVPNLVILVWDVPSNVGRQVLRQLRPCATNVAKMVTSHVAAQIVLSPAGSKASCRRIVVERTNGKMTLALDQLLMVLTKEKAPYSRIDGRHLVVNPEPGVVGFLRTMMICHPRSTKAMGGTPNLLLRSPTTITTIAPLAVTIHLLKGRIFHGTTRNIHQVRGNMALLRQDSPATPITALKEVRLELTFGFVVLLTVGLLGMYSACNAGSLKELFSVSSELYTLCPFLVWACFVLHFNGCLLQTRHVTLHSALCAAIQRKFLCTYTRAIYYFTAQWFLPLSGHF